MFWAWETTARYTVSRSMKQFTISIPMFHYSIPLNAMSFVSIKYDKISDRIIINGILNEETSNINMLVDIIDNGKTSPK